MEKLANGQLRGSSVSTDRGKGHLEADIDVGVICRCYVKGIVALTAVAGILSQNELLIADGEPLYLLGRTYDMEALR